MVFGHYLTNTITELRLLSSGGALGTATGFFLRDPADRTHWVLVTNWHVLAGRDWVSGQPRHASGAIPDTVRYRVGRIMGQHWAWSELEAPLVDPERGANRWWQHPTHGQRVDIAALPLGQVELPSARDLLEPDGHDPGMFIDLGDDLFLPGFPGLSADGWPVWKRASLASSLLWASGMHTHFLVDTASRPGMSGSPCLAITRGPYSRIDPNSEKPGTMIRRAAWRFLGVYSGRLNPSDGLEAQIGIVWREALIAETIQARCPGTVVLS